MRELEDRRQSYVLVRGAYDAHGDEVQPGIPAWLAWITRTVQGHLERRYLAWYRRTGTAPPDRVRYYEAYWLLHELVWSGERLRAGAVPDDAIEHRWLHAETLEVAEVAGG